MDTPQNPTNVTAQEANFIDKAIEEKRKADVAENKTDWRWDAWIDYRALNGTIIIFDETKDGETITKMTITELATKLGVNRDTLYEWEKSIPNFWDRVNVRHKQLASQRRVSFMRDKFYIKAMSWNDKFISMKWLEQNDPGWKDPRYKVEHEMGNSMADLMKQLYAEKEPEQKTYVDAEVVSRETQQPDNA